MRNRILSAMLILLLSCSALPAEMLNKMKAFNIQGGFGDFVEVVVDPIPSQTQAYLIGMPFNIEDKQVQYGATESGRLIANWSMLTNKPKVSMKITGEKLRHSGDANATPLDYELRFSYRLGYYIGTTLMDGGTKEAVFFSTADSESGNASPLFDFSKTITDGSFIGSIDGSVYFMLTEESSKKIRPEDGSTALYQAVTSTSEYFPVGDYTANVTISLEVMN